MFGKLLDFTRVRSPHQALGFYLIYVLIIILLSTITGGFFGFIYGNNSNEIEQIAKISGHAVSMIFCLTLYVLVMARKGFQQKEIYIFLALIVFILALVSGPIGGLAPVSYITTKK